MNIMYLCAVLFCVYLT